MTKKLKLLALMILASKSIAFAQNFAFNFNTSGRRVCLVSSVVDLNKNQVNILFLDSLSNFGEPLFVNRRVLGATTWTPVATALPPGTGHWTDNNVASGDIWEYQVKRKNTWHYGGINFDATGYTVACLQSDNTNYKGQMILLVANDVTNNLSTKYNRLKKEITADGWFVNEIICARATSWDSGNEVVTIKNQIASVYNNSPSNDKPKVIFILGHVPLPRCGSANIVSPDDHNENKGARGCDAYYADLDGVFTDVATFNPGGLATPLAVNLPGDYKWDQDFFPSDIEMSFGRIDFAGITELATPELQMIENYLDRLSNYRNVASGFESGDKAGFHFGYDNSNDGSFRNLPNIAKPNNVYQNYTGSNHNQWVQNNGPFKVYMQNISVPELNDWKTFGMNATVYASDQSYWGFGDVPQTGGIYSRIRALLGVDSKCLVTLWTTTGINMFHQACTGEALGVSMKTIMNHNSTNQYLEKPWQEYDTRDWWNRTHFAFYGDPTLNLYQIKPPSSISIFNVANEVVLNWTNPTDTNIIGYHVFESGSEFGKFDRISSSLITGNNFSIPNHQPGNWYMVKSVASISSGCGNFLHASIGVEIKGDLLLNNADINPNNIKISIYPNPGSTLMHITSKVEINTFQLYNLLGEKIEDQNLNSRSSSINIAHLNPGIYIVKLTTSNGKLIHTSRYVKGY